MRFSRFLIWELIDLYYSGCSDWVVLTPQIVKCRAMVFWKYDLTGPCRATRCPWLEFVLRFRLMID